jgi:hypothetical protein
MWFRALVNIPFATFVLVPLSLLRDMSSLAFASMLSLMSLTYVMLVMIIELPWYNKVYRDEPNLSIQFWSVDLNIFTASAMTFFAYTC